MELFCAVDILSGRCVRLLQGDYNAETVYNDDPVGVAVRMAEEGADWIHVVDLDGARSGHSENAEIVSEIAAAVNIPVQAGGGIRSQATAEAWFAAGVERVVLGTAALQAPEMVEALADSHRIAVALDARDNEIATDGWLQESGQTVLEVAKRFTDTGVDALIVTDIIRDGMLQGPNFKGLSEVIDAASHTKSAGPLALGAAHTSIDIIASGGVSRIDDLQALASLRGGFQQQNKLSGVIVGKALYEKRFSVAEAVAMLKHSKQL